MKLSQIITTFFLSLTCLTTYAQKGTWSGKIIIQGMELPLVFNFNDNNCTLDSPSQESTTFLLKSLLTKMVPLKYS